MFQCTGNLFTVRCTSCQWVESNNDSPICEALRDKGLEFILIMVVVLYVNYVFCRITKVLDFHSASTEYNIFKMHVIIIC